MNKRTARLRGPAPKAALGVIIGIFWFAPLWGAELTNSVSVPPPLHFRHIGEAEGFSQRAVYDIFQDRRGFLWFATDDGVNVYDGYVFKHYSFSRSRAEGVGNRKINRIRQDVSGTIWVATESSLDRLDPVADSFTHYTTAYLMEGRKIDSPVFTFCEWETDSSLLWAGTLNGLERFSMKTGRFTVDSYFDRLTHGMTNRMVRDIFVASNGVIWLCCNQVGIIRYTPRSGDIIIYARQPRYQTGKTFPTISGFTEILVSQWLPDRILLATARGLLSLNDQNGAFDYLINTQVISFSDSPTERGVIWLGSWREGLVRYDCLKDSASFYPISRQELEMDGPNRVYAVFQDPSSALWLGTDDGLYMAENLEKKFFHHDGVGDSDKVMTDPYISCIEESKSENGVYWIGTLKGLNRLNLYTGKNERFYPVGTDSEKAPLNSITAIHEEQANPALGSTGILWLGVERGHSLWRLDIDRKIFSLHQYDTLPAGWVSNNHPICFHKSPSDPGFLWIGGSLSGLFRIDLKSFAHTEYFFNTKDLPFSFSIYLIYESTQAPGIFWLATRNLGLICFDTKSGEHRIFFGDSLESRRDIYAISESFREPGILWIGASDGLYKFDIKRGKNLTFDRSDISSDCVIYGVNEDAEGQLWLSSQQGLWRFSPRTGIFKRFDATDGLPSLHFNRVSLRGRDGRLLLGGSDGLIHFYPHQIRENLFIPPVYITGLLLNNLPVRPGESWGGDSPILTQPLADTKKIRVSWRDKSLTLEYTTLNYNNSRKNRYFYKLEGFDSRWIDAGNSRRASYTNLEPGTYNFRVRGTNNDSLFNEKGAVLIIEIVPPFWRIWWFKLLSLVLFSTALYSLHRVRLRNISLKIRAESELQKFHEAHSLSPREQEILKLIIQGKSNGDIEAELFISLKTVKTHIYNIYRKVGVSTRLELINRVQGGVGGFSANHRKPREERTLPHDR